MAWVDIDKLIEKELRTKNKKRDDDTLYASEIGYCLRKTFYNYFEPREFPSEMLKRFIVGDLIHEKITELLQKKYLVKSEERVVLYINEGDFRIVGRYDD